MEPDLRPLRELFENAAQMRQEAHRSPTWPVISIRLVRLPSSNTEHLSNRVGSSKIDSSRKI